VSGKEILSGTDDFSGARAVDKDYWYSDNWDQNTSGKDYDWDRPFFSQFGELLRGAPIPSRFIVNLVDSEYCNNASDLKNCYLVFGCTFVEDSAFSDNSTHGKQIFDSSYITDSEVSYESMFNKKCYRALYSSYCEDSYDIYFCRDCIGCSNCIGCVNLRNKNYHIFNQPFSKENYEAELKKLALHKYSSIISLRGKVLDFWLKYPIRYVRGRKNENCTGEYISNSKNVRQSYYVNNGEDLKYCQGLYSKGGRDSYDQFRYGLNTELIYECTATGGHTVRARFCLEAFNNSHDVQYCFVVNGSSHLFGCVGLRKKQYCILNKQYTKEEYEKLVPKIIEHMNAMPYTDKKGMVYKYGEYFPTEISLYPYNDTVAQDFFPLTEAEAIEKGFAWRKPGKREYNAEVPWDKLPDSILDVGEGEMENKIISCANAKAADSKCAAHCATAFRLTPQELQFYRVHNVPLPRFCPNCRYLRRISKRNPIQLFQRKCQCRGSKSHAHGDGPCPNEFETSYAPDRPEIVYCEQCYNAEVA